MKRNLKLTLDRVGLQKKGTMLESFEDQNFIL